MSSRAGAGAFSSPRQLRPGRSGRLLDVSRRGLPGTRQKVSKDGDVFPHEMEIRVRNALASGGGLCPIAVGLARRGPTSQQPPPVGVGDVPSLSKTINRGLGDPAVQQTALGDPKQSQVGGDVHATAIVSGSPRSPGTIRAGTDSAAVAGCHSGAGRSGNARHGGDGVSGPRLAIHSPDRTEPAPWRGRWDQPARPRSILHHRPRLPASRRVRQVLTAWKPGRLRRPAEAPAVLPPSEPLPSAGALPPVQETSAAPAAESPAPDQAEPQPLPGPAQAPPGDPLLGPNPDLLPPVENSAPAASPMPGNPVPPATAGPAPASDLPAFRPQSTHAGRFGSGSCRSRQVRSLWKPRRACLTIRSRPAAPSTRRNQPHYHPPQREPRPGRQAATRLNFHLTRPLGPWRCKRRRGPTLPCARQPTSRRWPPQCHGSRDRSQLEGSG